MLEVSLRINYNKDMEKSIDELMLEEYYEIVTALKKEDKRGHFIWKYICLTNRQKELITRFLHSIDEDTDWFRLTYVNRDRGILEFELKNFQTKNRKRFEFTCPFTMDFATFKEQFLYELDDCIYSGSTVKQYYEITEALTPKAHSWLDQLKKKNALTLFSFSLLKSPRDTQRFIAYKNRLKDIYRKLDALSSTWSYLNGYKSFRKSSYWEEISKHDYIYLWHVASWLGIECNFMRGEYYAK